MKIMPLPCSQVEADVSRAFCLKVWIHLVSCLFGSFSIKEKVSPVTFIQKKIFGFRLSDDRKLLLGWLV